jgi:RNA polymerase sigma-70 factor (ECF subfamily)
LSHLRRNKSPVQKAVSLDEAWNVKENREDDDIRESALNRSLDSAIQNLPGKLKSVFLLHDYQGFKHDEIAEIMGWSVGTSKSQLFKARMKIRNNLKSRERLQEKFHEVQ